MGGDEYEDLIAFLRASKWFDEKARVREREDWQDSTLARIRWLLEVAACGRKLKAPADFSDCLPPRLRPEKPKVSPKPSTPRERAAAEAKIREFAASRKAKK